MGSEKKTGRVTLILPASLETPAEVHSDLCVRATGAFPPAINISLHRNISNSENKDPWNQ